MLWPCSWQPFHSRQVVERASISQLDLSTKASKPARDKAGAAVDARHRRLPMRFPVLPACFTPDWRIDKGHYGFSLAILSGFTLFHSP
jgi:hypothetical protein